MNAAEKQEEPCPYLTWDTCEIAQNRANELQEEDDELSEDAAFSQACEDIDLYTNEWDYVVSSLTDKMQEINPDGDWYCEAGGLGWQKRRGHKTFSATTGQDFLNALLPNTECTWRLFLEGEGDKQTIRIVNSHHDAMGEVYEIRAATEDEIDED